MLAAKECFSPMKVELYKIVTVGEAAAGNKRQFRVQTLFLNFQFHWNRRQQMLNWKKWGSGESYRCVRCSPTFRGKPDHSCGSRIWDNLLQRLLMSQCWWVIGARLRKRIRVPSTFLNLWASSYSRPINCLQRRLKLTFFIILNGWALIEWCSIHGRQAQKQLQELRERFEN